MTLTVLTKADATVTAGGVVCNGNRRDCEYSDLFVRRRKLAHYRFGRSSRSQETIRVILDTIKPILTISSITTTAAGVRVSGLTEPDVIVTANGYPLDVRSDGTFDQVIAGLSASEVTYEARDLAGNVTRDVRSATGSVDNSPPTFISLSFSPTSANNGSSVIATMVVADASPVSSTTLLSLTGPGGSKLTTTLFASESVYTGTFSVSSPSVVLAGTPSDQIAPLTPGSQTATAASATQISLGWGASSGVFTYKVYRSLNAGGGAPWQFIAQIASTSYTVGGLTTGTTYHFSVTASDNNSAPPSGIPNESTVGSGTSSATTL